MRLLEPTDAERRLADVLRRKCVEVIQSSMDLDAIADKLSLGRPGLQSLLWRSEWPLERAMRVAEALGIVSPDAIVELVNDQG